MYILQLRYHVQTWKIELVLATDLRAHFELVSQLQASYNDLQLETLFEKKSFVMQTALKMADIGHTAKKDYLHFKWSALIREEFFNQGDKEKELRLEVSPFM